MDAAKAGGEDFVTAVAIPIDDVDAVDHATVLVADKLPLPLAGAVENERRLVAVVRGHGLGADQGRVDYHSLAAAIDIGGAQAMGSGELVDFLDAPGLARVAVVAQHGDLPQATAGLHGEFAGEHDVRDAAAGRIDHRAVDHTGQAGGDDVALPGGILIPDQLRHAAGERDQVGLAVAIEVCRDHLVAALEIAGDGMFGKARRRAGGQKREREAKQADAMHAPQYTCRPGCGAMLWRTDRRLPKRLFGRG